MQPIFIAGVQVTRIIGTCKFLVVNCLSNRVGRL